MRTPLLVAAAGLAAGLLVGFVLPSSWVFVQEHAAHAGPEADDAQYACPMFCVVMDKMPADGKCPVCGMKLTVISGRQTLNAAERRMVGLEVDRLRHRPLARTVRVVGEVDYDETRLKRITTRAAGWLEKVWVDTTWTPVEMNQKLASIYSPELYAAQKEYLAAGDDLRGAAGRRLRLLGVSKMEIDELRRANKVQESLVLRAPRDGIVVERNAIEGGSVKKGDVLYTVADLSRVWVQAEVFERDLVWIMVGQEARLEVETLPQPIAGRVAFLDPIINRHTRTARIRIEVNNPATSDGGRLLRVGQRVDVWLQARVDARGAPLPPGRTPETDPLAIPRSAVLSTGNRDVAYLLFTEAMGKRDYNVDPQDLPATVFYELVALRLGALASSEGEEYYPVLGVAHPAGELKALTAGMAIVKKGNLLLDSQAQLSGKPSLLFPEGNRGTSEDPHAGH